MAFFTDLIASFFLGLLTPLTAVCVLPLYPGFLAYLANQFSPLQKQDSNNQQSQKRNYALFGFLVTIGVISFMLLLGLLFTTILKVSLTNVIGIISPIAFIILLLISLLLISNFDFSNIIPKPKTPNSKNPIISALLYGFFFGAIVIPCNPAFIGAFFARAILFDNFFSSIFNFLFFGLGLGFPLLLFSLLSVNYSQKIISILTRYKRIINIIAGIIMLLISIYYLICVFNIFDLGTKLTVLDPFCKAVSGLLPELNLKI
jgi:cytochrome c-type biogenesis protein